MAGSCAINFYLAERYAPRMLPTDAQGRALAYHWSFWAMTNLQPEALKVMFDAMLPAEKRNPDAVAGSRKITQRLIDEIEPKLGTFLIGDSLTVADVIAGSVVNLALRAGAATAGPKTTAWMESLRARPAYQKAVSAA